MKHKIINLAGVATFVVVGLIGVNAVAATIYDTSTPSTLLNGNAFTNVNGQEIGNEVVLAGSWDLSSFAIEYYAPNTLPGTIGIEVNIYQNNGAGTPASGMFPTPGTLIFGSGFFYGLASGPTGNAVTYTSSDFTAGGFASPYLLPGDFTFTVTYTNSDGSGNLYGLESPLANEPTGQPGTSYGDYWLNNAGSWDLLTNAVSAANLVVSVDGSAVPEPSVLYFGAFGSVLLFVNRLRKRYPIQGRTSAR
jgi:hypothetical protein